MLYKLHIPPLVEQPFPKEEGWYWFYGDPFCSEYHLEQYKQGEREENPFKPALYMVQVKKISNGFLGIFNGAFADNRLPGLWAKALVPEIPEKETR